MHHWAVTQSLSSDSHRVQGRNWMLSPHSNLSHLHKTMLSSAKNRNRSAGAQFHVFARAAIHPLGFTRLFCVWSSSAQQGTVSCPRTKCTWYSASCKSFKHIYEAGSFCSGVSYIRNVDFRILTFLFFTLTLTMSNYGKADENRSNQSGSQKNKYFFKFLHFLALIHLHCTKY